MKQAGTHPKKHNIIYLREIIDDDYGEIFGFETEIKKNINTEEKSKTCHKYANNIKEKKY